MADIYPLDRIILHWPAYPGWKGSGHVVTVPACRTIPDGVRRRDEDEHNCIGRPEAVTCKSCRRTKAFRGGTANG